jgi:Do/DeqQ family serine protease
MRNTWTVIISSLLSACLAVWIYKSLETPQYQLKQPDAKFAAYTGYEEKPYNQKPLQRPPQYAPTNFIGAASLVTPAVVNIRTLSASSFEWLGSGSYTSSNGSGVIVSYDGYIVTNNHVIEDGGKIEVTLNDHREYSAQLIATDPATDIALLKIDEKDLPFLLFGNSDSLRVGEWVLAVGNPFNLSSTVTAGIVSALGRSIDVLDSDYSIESFIQTDAAVNPGNSGGALVNTNGDLVGINTAIMTQTGRYEGYSFAVPANLVQKVIKDLKEFGEVKRGLLGVRIGPVNVRIAKEAGLPSVEGIYINGVTAGGGAADAGLKGGDIIIAINDVRMSSVPQMQEFVGRMRPGAVIKVQYFRSGQSNFAMVKLKDKNESKGFTVLGRGTEISKELGFEMRDLSTEERRRIRILGAYVSKVLPGSTISKTQLESGYIITKIDNIRVTSVQEVLDVLSLKKGKDVFFEGIYEKYEGDFYYTFRNK